MRPAKHHLPDLPGWIAMPDEVEAKVREWQNGYPGLVSVETQRQYCGLDVFAVSVTGEGDLASLDGQAQGTGSTKGEHVVVIERQDSGGDVLGEFSVARSDASVFELDAIGEEVGLGAPEGDLLDVDLGFDEAAGFDGEC